MGSKAPAAPTPTRMTQEQLAAFIIEQMNAAGLDDIRTTLAALEKGPPGTETPWTELLEAAAGKKATRQPTPGPSPYSAGHLAWNLGISPAVRERAAITPVAYRAGAGAVPREQDFPGQAMAQFVRAMTASQRSIRTNRGYRTPQQCATSLYGESHHVTAAIAAAVVAAEEAEVKNAIDSTASSRGAILIPPGFTSDFIELLRPATVFLAAGPQVVSNPTGNLPIPKQTGGAVAGYITEGQPIPVTEASFGQENAVSKHIGAITVISNVWLDRADPGADQMIIRDLLNGVSQKVDQVGLRSTGSGGEPKGMRYWAHTDNVLTAQNPTGGDSAAVVAQKVENTYQALWLALASNNVAITSPHIFMSARTFSFLKGLRDGNGNLIYRDELNRGLWGQIPVSWTNQIPNDLGGGTESEIILANMDDIVFADEKAVEVVVDENAIQDGATVKALFSLNQSAVRVIARHDIIARYSRAIAIAKGCTWGTV